MTDADSGLSDCSVSGGAMTITMAIMYERDDHYATELFTVTTLLSILTMPLCMLIAG